jgi:solute carrier family 25 iron transporter 28/37
MEHAFSADVSGREMLAGGIAGMSEHLATFPFDTLKTRMQDDPSRFRTLRSTVLHVVRTERVRNLYRGCGPIVASAFPAHAAYFSLYEHAKRQLGSDATWKLVAAATVATLGHDAVSVPFDVIKQSMQRDVKFASSLECCRSIVAERGFLRLFSSFPTTAAMNVPHMATHWVVYEHAKTQLGIGEDTEEALTWQFITAGFAAGACSSVVSTPFDMLKTQIQLNKARGIAAAFELVTRDRGVAALWTGVVPRVMFVAPSAAVVMTSYELCKRALGA